MISGSTTPVTTVRPLERDRTGRRLRLDRRLDSRSRRRLRRLGLEMDSGGAGGEGLNGDGLMALHIPWREWTPG